MNEAAMQELADRFCDAVATRDGDVVEQLYAPGVVVWHAARPSSTTDQNRQRFRVAAGAARSLSYGNVRRRYAHDGWVQQHDVHMVGADEVERVFPSCMVVTVDEGLIARIDEYTIGAPAAAPGPTS